MATFDSYHLGDFGYDLRDLEVEKSPSYRLIIQIGVLQCTQGLYEKRNDAKSLKKAKTIKKLLERINYLSNKGIIAPLSDDSMHGFLYEK